MLIQFLLSKAYKLTQYILFVQSVQKLTCKKDSLLFLHVIMCRAISWPDTVTSWSLVFTTRLTKYVLLALTSLRTSTVTLNMLFVKKDPLPILDDI